MDESTRTILTAVITGVVTILAGNPLWNYFAERMRREKPTSLERNEVENTNARVALEIVASLRQDLERLQKELTARQTQFEGDLKAIRAENDTELGRLRIFYEERMETLRSEYEARIEVLKSEYETRIKRSEDEADNLRARIAILEEERKILLKLSDAFEKARKAGTISGD